VKKQFNGDREKDGKILEMYHHGHTYDQIAKELHVAPNQIASVIKANRMRVDKEKRDKQNARALQLFSQGKSLLDVSIKLAMSPEGVLRLHDNYLELTSRYKLLEIIDRLGENAPDLVHLYETMENSGISAEEIVSISKDYFEIPFVRARLRKLIHMEEKYEDKLDSVSSQWLELDKHNSELKMHNKNLEDRSSHLEDRICDLENKNRSMLKENLRLRLNRSDLEKSLTELYEKFIDRLLPLFGPTSPDPSNNTFLMKKYPSGDQDLR
jgi:transcriptional regulator